MSIKRTHYRRAHLLRAVLLADLCFWGLLIALAGLYFDHLPSVFLGAWGFFGCGMLALRELERMGR